MTNEETTKLVEKIKEGVGKAAQDWADSHTIYLHLSLSLMDLKMMIEIVKQAFIAGAQAGMMQLLELKQLDLKIDNPTIKERIQ